MEDNLHSAVSLDSDHEGEWKELIQKWDEQGLSSMLNTEQWTSSSSLLLNPTSSQAMESLSPAFYPSSHRISPSTPLTTASMNPSLIGLDQRNAACSHPLLTLDTSASRIDPLHSTSPTLNPVFDDISRTSSPSGPDTLPYFSWLSSFLQSRQSHPAVGTVPPPSHESLLNCDEEQKQALGSATQMNTGTNSLDKVLEQLSTEFINYGTAGSLQEHLGNALNASDLHQLILSNASLTTPVGGSFSTHDNIEYSKRNMMFCTPASSVSSDGGPEDTSSSREDTSNPLDRLDEFMMHSGATPVNDLSATATPLPSSESTSPPAGMKLETSPAPSASDQDQLKKRALKPARAPKKPKRERGTKLAIKILSDVEILDDGYKWRKYGQKPVKNSPYPRSYYKCTDKQCSVKKHVERQAHEPEFVVATYEGVHNHSRPDQQVHIVHPSVEAATQSHGPFQQPFAPPPMAHNMELLSLRAATSLLPPPAIADKLSRPTPAHHHSSLQSVDHRIWQSLFCSEPRTSSY